MKRLILNCIMIFCVVELIYSIKSSKGSLESKNYSIVVTDSLPSETNIFDTVLATKYNPTVAQCGEGCLITADMSIIDMELLESYSIKWIAVSRDLLEKYSLGDTVVINSNNEKLEGEWIIHDVMPKRWKNKIDLLVPEDDEYEFTSPEKVIISKKNSV